MLQWRHEVACHKTGQNKYRGFQTSGKMCWIHRISVIADSKRDKRNYVAHTFSTFIFVHADNVLWLLQLRLSILNFLTQVNLTCSIPPRQTKRSIFKMISSKEVLLIGKLRFKKEIHPAMQNLAPAYPPPWANIVHVYICKWCRAVKASLPLVPRTWCPHCMWVGGKEGMCFELAPVCSCELKVQ